MHNIKLCGLFLQMNLFFKHLLSIEMTEPLKPLHTPMGKDTINTLWMMHVLLNSATGYYIP